MSKITTVKYRCDGCGETVLKNKNGRTINETDEWVEDLDVYKKGFTFPTQEVDLCPVCAKTYEEKIINFFMDGGPE